jgi:guanylate kinase
LRFPDAAGTSAIRPNEDVWVVKIRFAKEFWFVSEKEFTKKIARDKLEEVATPDFVEILVP